MAYIRSLKRKGLTLPLVMICGLNLAAAADEVRTANPNTSTDGKKILAYFYSLTDRTDHRVISGQFTAWSSGASKGYQNEIVSLYNTTKKWVGMVGYDFRDGLDLQLPIKAWKDGHLITISFHYDNPIVGGNAWVNGGNLAEVLKAGSSSNTKWLQMLDKTAAELKKLQDAGVVVLWRPFHEQNGGWFWWGAKSTADFTAIWRQMFTYFSTTKGLNNLIWVFAPNINNSPEKYYPGDAYVDMVGLDGYFNQPTSLNLVDYEKMAAFKKPFGLTEFGPVPANGGSTKVWDNAILIRDIKTKYPKLCFYMNWHSPWSMLAQNNPTGLMNDPWVVDRESLDWKNASVSLSLQPKLAKPKFKMQGFNLLNRHGKNLLGRERTQEPMPKNTLRPLH